MEIEQIDQSFGTKLYNLLKTNADNQYVQCPCRVTAVNGEYVDVLPIINDDIKNQELYDVKIRREESSSAYIFLKVHVGDRGVLRFFDRSIADYSVNGSEEYNQDDRMHDVNDGCFELGFVPDSEIYEFPVDKEIEIGLKNKTFTLSIDENGQINLTTNSSMTINIEENVTLNVKGNVTATIEGDMTNSVQGNISNTVSGNLTADVSGTSSITCPTSNIVGNINVTGGIITTGDVVANGISLFSHLHSGVTTGAEKTDVPTM